MYAFITAKHLHAGHANCPVSGIIHTDGTYIMWCPCFRGRSVFLGWWWGWLGVWFTADHNAPCCFWKYMYLIKISRLNAQKCAFSWENYFLSPKILRPKWMPFSIWKMHLIRSTYNKYYDIILEMATWDAKLLHGLVVSNILCKKFNQFNNMYHLIGARANKIYIVTIQLSCGPRVTEMGTITIIYMPCY